MKAVDEGISQKSDKIAQKVLQIQRKVCLSSPIVYDLQPLMTSMFIARVCARL